MRAAGRTLCGGHFDGRLRSRSTAVLFRAVVTCALLARNADFFGDSLVARNFFLDGLDHAAFAALGIAFCVDFLGYNIVVACFHLARLSAVSGIGSGHSEHGAAGREAHGEDCKAK